MTTERPEILTMKELATTASDLARSRRVLANALARIENSKDEVAAVMSGIKDLYREMNRLREILDSPLEDLEDDDEVCSPVSDPGPEDSSGECEGSETQSD